MTREEIEQLKLDCQRQWCSTEATAPDNWQPATIEPKRIIALADFALAKESAYDALLAAMEACRKRREEVERKVDELRKQIQCGSA